MKIKTELFLAWLGLLHYLNIGWRISWGIISYFMNVFGALFFYIIFIPFILLPSELFQNFKFKKKMEEQKRKRDPILTPDQEKKMGEIIDEAIRFKKRP